MLPEEKGHVMSSTDTTEQKAKADPRLTDELIYLFNEGKYYNAYNTFGAHPDEEIVTERGDDGKARQVKVGGVRFTVWAPGVESVRVTGDFNGWDMTAGEGSCFLEELQGSGIWSGFVPGAKSWQLYKYNIGYRDHAEISGENKTLAEAAASGGNADVSASTRRSASAQPVMKYIMKADPFAFTSESRPGTASRIADMTYEWQDGVWMEKRARRDTFRSPMNIYEMHLGSWRRHEDGTFLTYVELADILPDYLKDMGYTHVEFLPLMEHPFDSSWGYQVTGYYAPTSRYGSPGDLRYLIDRCHQAGIGVILDWVPGHFCMDEHGLGRFNGGMLYESGEHPEWGTYKFDFSRPQVRSFLLSNAMYWIEQYHIDGIRVDSVSSMLYLNYGVKDEKQRRYNMFGDERDLDAMEFLKEFNYMVGTRAPGVFTVAEESTTWPHVTAPPDAGGLGFHYKWHMGWMNDTLEYMKTDFPDRCYEHDRIAGQPGAAYNENYVLALSHDEVVHGKRSLISKMPGDIWRQFAGIRLLSMYQMTHPGKKLSFMGHELAEFIEWRDYEGLEWFMLDHENHRKYKEFIRDINHLYLEHPALWDSDTDWRGFRWIDAGNSRQQIFTYVRKSLMSRDQEDFDRIISAAFYEKSAGSGADSPANSSPDAVQDPHVSAYGDLSAAARAAENTGETLIVVLNASAETYDDFRIGVPEPGMYEEIINSDDVKYAGSGRTNRNVIAGAAFGSSSASQSVIADAAGRNSDDSRVYGDSHVERADTGRMYRGLVTAVPEPAHGMPYSIRITVPPLGGCIFRKE